MGMGSVATTLRMWPPVPLVPMVRLVTLAAASFEPSGRLTSALQEPCPMQLGSAAALSAMWPPVLLVPMVHLATLVVASCLWMRS